MRIALFYHSLISDWNHGNAHFLRGIATELIAAGHEVEVYEPRDGWSMENLLDEHGEEAVEAFHRAYPHLSSIRYDLRTDDLEEALRGVDLILVHEWNDHALVERLGEFRRQQPRSRLLFHDTHHRSLTYEHAMDGYVLDHYDGVLAYGQVIRDIYLQKGWTQHAWTWHEAADTRVFHPKASPLEKGDLVWIGNWGDEERTDELQEFLIEPAADLGLDARVHGVRYPEEAQERLEEAGIEYAGWVANYRVPDVFARYRATIHVPRRPYVETLKGIPTIRPFEALACGIPLISSPWEDAEHLFRPGEDYLVARDGEEMRDHLRMVLNDPDCASELAANGLETIRERHTCAHRVQELMEICTQLGLITTTTAAA